MLPQRSLAPERDFLEAGSGERDGRIGDLRRRLLRVEGEGSWMRTAVFAALLGVGVLGPAIGIALSERGAGGHREELARIEEQVERIGRDLDEVLAVLAAERTAPPRRAFVKRDPFAPAIDTSAAGAPDVAGGAATRAPAPRQASRSAAPPTAPADAPRPPIDAEDWARVFSRRVLEGSLDARERASLRDDWARLNAPMQRQILKALPEIHGLDAEAFLAALQDPTPDEP